MINLHEKKAGLILSPVDVKVPGLNTNDGCGQVLLLNPLAVLDLSLKWLTI